jgi:sortase A
MRGGSIAVVCAGLLALTSCGNDANANSAAVESIATSGTTTTTTTPASTSTTSTTSTTIAVTTSTSSSTTTTVAATLPNPESPPADPRAPEALVELGTIEIPKIAVTKSIYEGITLTTLDHGPGHWPGTTSPSDISNSWSRATT